MITYPIDWTRPWSVLFDNPETQKAVISAHTKDIHVDGATFGDRIICVTNYKDLKLSKDEKRRARHALNTGNIDLLKNVYASVIAQHPPTNNK